MAVGENSSGTAPASIDTTDAGATWTNDTVRSNVASLDAVSCLAPETCLGIGSDTQGNGAIIKTG